MAKAYLILENGKVFEGESFGAAVDVVGELVFNTSAGGCTELLTDPGEKGKIILSTFPSADNCGINEEDFQGDEGPSGLVVRQWSETPSNFRMEYNVDTLMKKRAIAGLCGVDTRQITRILRSEGNMKAAIVSEAPENIAGLFVSQPETLAVKNEVKEIKAENERYKVVLLDLGAKKAVYDALLLRGCTVIGRKGVYSAEEILSDGPDGIVIAGGTENDGLLEAVKNIFGKKPIMAIGGGHILLAKALGADIIKLKNGHHGENQPCRRLSDGKIFITAQSHELAVDNDSVKTGIVSYVNVNDGSCEGIDYPEVKSFSVQFSPEACAGPLDSEFLFDNFIASFGGEN